MKLFSLIILFNIWNITNARFIYPNSFPYIYNLNRENPVQKNKSIKDPWLSFDKWKHFSASFYMTISAYYIATRGVDSDKSTATQISGAFVLSMGLGKEFYDRWGKGGFFSYKDIIFNFLGVFLPMALINNRIIQ
jgi:uncharacterized protein YfiM (DUF2279 family)